ncbi:MAG TPA: hypothetical protein DCG75_02585 [Bacteroidales bacterium]|nr:hypothetical protein [Bacteroidales bacterium]
MKKLEKSLVILISLFIINSCTQSPNEKSKGKNNLEQIEDVCNRVWNDLEIHAESQVSLNQNEIDIKVKFVSDYYITAFTNELLIDYLIYSFDSLLHGYKRIKIEYSYYDLIDVHLIVYEDELIKQLQNDLKNSKCFVDLIPIIIRNTTTVEIIGFNEMLKDLKNYYSDEEFSFGGDFWKFTYLYTKNCCDTSSVVYDHMDIVKYAAEYPESPNRPDIFQRIIDEGKKHCAQLSEEKTKP